jgi:hypothetical protein
MTLSMFDQIQFVLAVLCWQAWKTPLLKHLNSSLRCPSARPTRHLPFTEAILSCDSAPRHFREPKAAALPDQPAFRTGDFEQITLRLGPPEHRQAASRLRFRGFILQNIPVFRKHAVDHSDNIGGGKLNRRSCL